MKKLAESIKTYVFAVKWEQARTQKVKVYNLAKDLLNTWNSKIEYIKYKKFLSVVKRMQLNFKLTVFKRHFRLYKYSAMVLGRSFKLYQIRKILFNAKKIIIAVNNCSTKLMFKLFMVRVRINKRILNGVLDDAWSVIEGKFKEKSGKTIQRIWRGYFERIKSNEEVIRLRILK